mgnify:FL=1
MKFVLAIASLLVLSTVYARPASIKTFEEFKVCFPLILFCYFIYNIQLLLPIIVESLQQKLCHR